MMTMMMMMMVVVKRMAFEYEWQRQINEWRKGVESDRSWCTGQRGVNERKCFSASGK